VVGAGPKAIALTVKAHVLKQLGWSVPEITVIEKSTVAAHWTGEHGFTDGEQVLGTSPEKDVGFPYASSCWDSCNDVVNDRMLAYSWQSYLIRGGLYAAWIDRGRPQPTHAVWAKYLRWVAERIEMHVIIGEVKRIASSHDSWVVEYRSPGGAMHSVAGDGLVLTGPGPSRTIGIGAQPSARILDAASFWPNKDAVCRSKPSHVVVAGTGESASSIVLCLSKLLGPETEISLVSPHGVIYTRGEGFEENKLFSLPDGHWPRLSEEHRREFIRRTDRGVFSTFAQRALGESARVRVVVGQVTSLTPRAERVEVEVTYGASSERLTCDYAIASISCNPLWFIDLLDPRTCQRLEAAVGARPERTPDPILFERAIAPDLSIAGLHPRLHLPMLAGLQQGPGFPNLSCLGLLSDRVLAAYASSDRSPAAVFPGIRACVAP
jgi:mycobactin lysine-N-oxygenase